uniref:Uncharacterized protein TCIL3000_11_9820 n=1 Tax=Trypanosoma congolense (strain IL3000) TaxID=1068625 RepID=G0V1J4_TRYCI|nr:unnamed protein product [Trypanosoma congolense IL3000]
MATQQQSKTEIVHDVTNAVKLEQELQQVQEHHGVAVLDVYSSEWGFTKALSETFRRLHMDSCDGTYLRFFSVECNSVLETIDQTSERHKHMKDDEKKQFRETLSTFWKDILEGRRGKSKSFFVFFKEGTKRTSIEGVNTPKIISCVNELCRVQRPAKEFTGKTQLLNFWEYHFSQGESEVFWESFVRAALEHSEATRQLTTKENQTLADVIGVEGEKVSVQALDKWVADQTVEGALLTVFPFLSKDYEDPMASVAKKRLGLGESTGDDSTIDGGFVNILTSNCEVRTTKKPALWQQVLELQLRYPPTEHLVLMSHQHGAQEATEALAVMENLQTLNAYLTERNVTAENIHMMCHAAAEKGLSGSLSYAKLALLLVSCNDETLGRLIGVSENVVDKLLKGELIKEYPALAYTVICHCASEVPCEKSFYYCRSDASHVEQIEIAQEGNQVVLPPFTQLSTSGETEGAFKVEVRGIPQVIELTAPRRVKKPLF